MKPSYEQLEAELAITKTELAETKEKVVRLTELLQLALEEIADLKARQTIESIERGSPEI